ncbi:MAG: DNA topoisomerase IV subunit A [bacterium]|nr:DNA topoisomerase IV subunit A [bacterium]
MKDVLQKIYEYSLEEIIGIRFGSYSKYIIQERAIPDVRDGLKPVQRRILYTMHEGKYTHDKPFKKSARIVGDVMGKYHPHGDSSIYEAMVRMSQTWKTNTTLIDMEGNNGSIDGDSPAAMRYTEARLSKVAGELLKDIDKNVVKWTPNYDDSLKEPVVLPAKFPNLLVNGAMGISAGYATNIPPHNLGEIIDATIYRIDNPTCQLEEILNIVKGPDFPTGAIVYGQDGIRSAFTTGKGKVTIRAKAEIVKNQIIITEIPYEVNMSLLVKKIDEIRIDKKCDGIIEVRDDFNKDGLQITIDLKKSTDASLVLNYLYKNTELQITYNYNMISIVNKRPMLLGIIGILDAYIAHQKEVVKNKTEYDLAHAKARFHIVEGLIKALGILDEVIKTIRSSKNRMDAINNLVEQYQFSELQAKAIVDLQLYRLTNTDVVALQEELANLTKIIDILSSILQDEKKLKRVIKEELKRVKKEYAIPRLTKIEDTLEEIKIDVTKMIPKEDVVVSITKAGYIKRTSLRSYNSCIQDDITLKENDYIIGLYNTNTTHTILIFTNKGNYIYLPVYDIPEAKWKDLGKHISNIIELEDEEKIISSIAVDDFDKDKYITIFTKYGMTKRTLLKDFKVSRYSKTIKMIKLKDNDVVVSVTSNNYDNCLIITNKGYTLWYDTSSIPIIGIKASGVKAIKLKDDEVVSAQIFNNECKYITIITDKSTAKRVKLSELTKGTRANRGTLIMKEIKSNPSHVIATFILDTKDEITIITDKYIKNIKVTDIPIMDKVSNGSFITKNKIVKCYINSKINEVTEDNNVLEEINQKMATVDNILKDIK